MRPCELTARRASSTVGCLSTFTICKRYYQSDSTQLFNQRQGASHSLSNLEHGDTSAPQAAMMDIHRYCIDRADIVCSYNKAPIIFCSPSTCLHSINARCLPSRELEKQPRSQSRITSLSLYVIDFRASTEHPWMFSRDSQKRRHNGAVELPAGQTGNHSDTPPTSSKISIFVS